MHIQNITTDATHDVVVNGVTYTVTYDPGTREAYVPVTIYNELVRVRRVAKWLADSNGKRWDISPEFSATPPYVVG
jgi:hypothetical protein